MKTFAVKEKRSAPAVRKARPYVHHPMGSVKQAQQMEIRRILRSTGAQAKLTIGQPNDKYEQEADRVADQVMAMPDPKLQRQPENEEEEEPLQAKPLADQITPLVRRQEEPPDEEEEELQTKSKPGGSPVVTPSLESRINSLKDGGQPLNTNVRSFFEPRFGHDFSSVRVHHGEQAADISRSINARAFTMGSNVVFGSGEFSSGSSSGRRLLAHELTHVVQQEDGGIVRHKRASTPFSDTDTQTANNAQSIQAKVFALGSNIVFNSGQYSPNNQEGKKLLAHELVHTIQQDTRWANNQNKKSTQKIPNRAIGTSTSAGAYPKVQHKLSGIVVARDGTDPYRGSRPRILSVNRDTVTIVNAAGYPETVTMVNFRSVWMPKNAGNPAVAFSNEVYQRAWHEILNKAGLPVSVSSPGVSIELWDAPPAASAKERVKLWLTKQQSKIVGAERKFFVDRRAIAGAIAWEALENVRTHHYLGLARFSGPGKVHHKEGHVTEGDPVAEQVEKAGYLPRLSTEKREKVLAKPSGAITYIGAIMNAFADEAAKASYNIRCNPAILCTFYNAWDLIQARTLFLKKRAPIKLNVGPDMGAWVAKHLDYLSGVVGHPSSYVCERGEISVIEQRALDDVLAAEDLSSLETFLLISDWAQPKLRRHYIRNFIRYYFEIRLHTPLDEDRLEELVTWYEDRVSDQVMHMPEPHVQKGAKGSRSP